jgi:phage recombination protein Bet
MTELARRDPVATLARQLDFDRDELSRVLAATVMPSGTSKEQAIAFCAVASSVGLNPLKKEIYAFPGKNGAVQPIVGVDGWITLARRKDPDCYFDFEDQMNDAGQVVAIRCTVIGGAGKPLASAVEYMSECRGTTQPWQKWPVRMLRHKALIQAIRMAYGVSGVMDEDDYHRMVEAEVMDERPAHFAAPKTLADATAKLRSERGSAAVTVEAEPVDADAVDEPMDVWGDPDGEVNP